MSKQKKSGGTRKYGRSDRKPGKRRYDLEGRREKNAARRRARHEKRQEYFRKRRELAG